MKYIPNKRIVKRRCNGWDSTQHPQCPHGPMHEPTDRCNGYCVRCNEYPYQTKHLCRTLYVERTSGGYTILQDEKKSAPTYVHNVDYDYTMIR